MVTCIDSQSYRITHSKTNAFFMVIKLSTPESFQDSYLAATLPWQTIIICPQIEVGISVCMLIDYLVNGMPTTGDKFD